MDSLEYCLHHCPHRSMLVKDVYDHKLFERKCLSYKVYIEIHKKEVRKLTIDKCPCHTCIKQPICNDICKDEVDNENESIRLYCENWAKDTQFEGGDLLIQ